VLPKPLLVRLRGAPALVLLCLTFLVSARAEAAVDSYIDFDSHDTQTELATGREDGGCPGMARPGSHPVEPVAR
jgi:hypothetical protein